ncbi:MAG: hypothetical protein Q8P16_00700 [bacterium]|nr:hypothetical protein [bacterium]
MVLPLEKTFLPDKYLGLSVEKPAIPDFVRKTATENGLNEKPEFHISVLVAKNVQTAWRTIAARTDANLAYSLESVFKNYEWEYEPTDEYFLHEHTFTSDELIENGEDAPPHTRRSIVQRVFLPDLPAFYAKVSELLGISLPIPVPHITLFAWSDYEPFKTRGIGINSADEFRQFTVHTLVAD